MISENIILIAAVFSAAVFDYRSRRVPNFLTIPAVVVGVAAGFLQGGLAGISVSALGLALGIAFLSVPYAMGGIGAGDVKLLGAIGAIKGPWFVFATFLSAAIIGGIMAVFRAAFIIKSSDMMVLRDSLKTVYYTGALSDIEVPEYLRKESLPYAVAISGGAIAALVMEIR